MTDRALAVALAQVMETERLAREGWESACRLLDAKERDSAIAVMRQAIGLKRMLEQWMTARALRAAQTT